MCLNSKSSLFFPLQSFLPPYTRSVVPSCASAHWFFCTIVCISILSFDHKKPSRPPGLVMMRAQPLHCSWCFMKPHQRTALGKWRALHKASLWGKLGCSLFWGQAAMGTEQGLWLAYRVSKAENLYQGQDAL